MSRGLNEEQSLLSEDEDSYPESEYISINDEKEIASADVKGFLDNRFLNSQEESAVLTRIVFEYLDPIEDFRPPEPPRLESEEKDHCCRCALAILLLCIFFGGLGACIAVGYREEEEVGPLTGGFIAITGCLVLAGVACWLESYFSLQKERKLELPSRAEAVDAIYNFFRPVPSNRPHATPASRSLAL